MNKKFVVIGSSAAGTGAVASLARLAPDAQIVWITQDEYLPYNKCLLVDFVQARKTKDQLELLPQDFFSEKKNIQFLTSTVVCKIDRMRKQIITADGEEVTYDKLLLALGVEPIRIPDQLIKCAGVFQAHGLQDFEAIHAYSNRSQVTRALVIGAGLTGLEVASALHMRGVAVTLIEKNNYLLSSLITRDASEFLREQLSPYVSLSCGVAVQQYLFDERSAGRRITGVQLADNSFLQADMIICARGARPRIELARKSGLMVDRGILVDDFFHTSDPHIFASGDCAQLNPECNLDQLPDADVEGRLSSTWAEAFMQGGCAAQNLLGIAKNYRSVSFVSSVSSHFFNQKLLVYGLFTDNSRNVFVGHDSICYVFMYNQKIVGCMLLGNLSEAITAPVKKLVREQAHESIL